MRGGVGLRGVLDVGAEQDQAAGAALAVGGGEAGLGAADLAGEGGALAYILQENRTLRAHASFMGDVPVAVEI